MHKVLTCFYHSAMGSGNSVPQEKHLRLNPKYIYHVKGIIANISRAGNSVVEVRTPTRFSHDLILTSLQCRIAAFRSRLSRSHRFDSGSALISIFFREFSSPCRRVVPEVEARLSTARLPQQRTGFAQVTNSDCELLKGLITLAVFWRARLFYCC